MTHPPLSYTKNWESQHPVVYDALLEIQDGECALCERMGDRTRLYVDHCHQTDLVRGLLCRSCNCALVWVERRASRASVVVDSDWERRAKRYIEDPPSFSITLGQLFIGNWDAKL